MRNFKLNGFSILILLSLSACSMKDRTQAHSVSVQLPSVWANSSTLNVLNNSSSVMSINYNAPTTLGSFQCYGLNVTGPGIQSDARMGCTDPASGMGMIAGFVPVSSGRIEMMVPAGGNRKVELVGIQSDVGCPILDALLASGGREALGDLGHPYILGSSVVDIFDDTAVTIVASFDPTKKAFSGCGDGGGDSPQLRLNVISDSPMIQANHCSPIGIYTQNENSMPAPSVQPIVTATPSMGSVSFYPTNVCSPSPISAALAFPSPSQSNYIQVYAKTSLGASGTFTAHADTVTAGWGMPPVTYNIVSDRLSAFTSPTPSIGACEPVTVSNHTDNTGTPLGSLGTIDLEVRSNGMNVTTAQIFTNISCTGSALTPDYNSYGADYYDGQIVVGASPSYTFYVKNANPESVSIGISRSDNNTEPTQIGMNFSAFNMNMPGGPLTSVPAGGGTFSLTFNAPDYANGISEIKIGGVSCGSYAPITGNLLSAPCTVIPANSPGSSLPITLVKNSVEYSAGVNMNYGVAPTFGAMNYVVYQGIPVTPAITLPVNNLLAGTCVAGPIPGTSGLTLNLNCEVSGNSSAPAGVYTPGVTVTSIFGTDTQTLNITVVEPVGFSAGSTFDPYPNMSVCSTGNGCSYTAPGSYTLNVSPTVNLIPQFTGFAGSTCSINVTAGSLPGWLTFNSGTCQFTGTKSGSGSMTFTLNVTKPPFAPLVTSSVTFSW